MEKKTSPMWIRVAAVIGAVLIMIGAAGSLPQSAAKTFDASKNIYTQASGIAADAVLMTVDGQDITAQEYLYYVLNVGYQYYSYLAAAGTVDWTMPVDDAGTLTLADMVMSQAQESVTQDAVIRKMAADNGIALTQETEEEIEQSIISLKETYGEAYESLLMAYGLTEELWRVQNRTSHLSGDLQTAYVSGDLRPDEAALEKLVQEHGLAMGRSVVISTGYLEDGTLEQAKASATDYRERILAADDMSAELAAVNSELGIAEEENVASLYHCGHDHGDGEEDVVCEALNALEVGELSEVIEAEDGFYLLLREDLDMDIVAQMQYSEDLEAAVSSAEIIYNEENMAKVNVGVFIENFMAMLATLNMAE